MNATENLVQEKIFSKRKNDGVSANSTKKVIDLILYIKLKTKRRPVDVNELFYFIDPVTKKKKHITSEFELDSNYNKVLLIENNVILPKYVYNKKGKIIKTLAEMHPDFNYTDEEIVALQIAKKIKTRRKPKTNVVAEDAKEAFQPELPFENAEAVTNTELEENTDSEGNENIGFSLLNSMLETAQEKYLQSVEIANRNYQQSIEISTKNYYQDIDNFKIFFELIKK